MSEVRLKIKAAVYLIFKRSNQYLFLRRYNTGWSDGLFTVPAGHIDPGETPTESAIREAKEKVDISLTAENLHFAHVLYEKDQYTDFYFIVDNWQGETKLNEPEKSDEIAWMTLENQDKIIPKILLALKQIEAKQTFTELKSDRN